MIWLEKKQRADLVFIALAPGRVFLKNTRLTRKSVIVLRPLLNPIPLE